jgi:hypothetical protein
MDQTSCGRVDKRDQDIYTEKKYGYESQIEKSCVLAFVYCSNCWHYY